MNLEQAREVAQRLRECDTFERGELEHTIDSLVAEVERLTAVNATVTHANKAMHEELEKALAKVEPACNPHPDAPHGFDRNGSHNAGRYVCECEGWTAPEKVEPVATLWRAKNQKLYPGAVLELTHVGEALPLGFMHPLYPASSLAAAKDAAWKEGYKQGAADNEAATEAGYPSPALAAEKAKVRELVDCIEELVDCIEDLLDAVPPLWECAERAVDLLERIGEQK
jgi:hypothetical protein